MDSRLEIEFFAHYSEYKSSLAYHKQQLLEQIRGLETVFELPLFELFPPGKILNHLISTVELGLLVQNLNHSGLFSLKAFDSLWWRRLSLSEREKYVWERIKEMKNRDGEKFKKILEQSTYLSTDSKIAIAKNIFGVKSISIRGKEKNMIHRIWYDGVNLRGEWDEIFANNQPDNCIPLKDITLKDDLASELKKCNPGDGGRFIYGIDKKTLLSKYPCLKVENEEDSKVSSYRPAESVRGKCRIYKRSDREYEFFEKQVAFRKERIIYHIVQLRSLLLGEHFIFDSFIMAFETAISGLDLQRAGLITLWQIREIWNNSLSYHQIQFKMWAAVKEVMRLEGENYQQIIRERKSLTTATKLQLSSALFNVKPMRLSSGLPSPKSKRHYVWYDGTHLQVVSSQEVLNAVPVKSITFGDEDSKSSCGIQIRFKEDQSPYQIDTDTLLRERPWLRARPDLVSSEYSAAAQEVLNKHFMDTLGIDFTKLGKIVPLPDHQMSSDDTHNQPSAPLEYNQQKKVTKVVKIINRNFTKAFSKVFCLNCVDKSKKGGKPDAAQS